MRVHELRDGVRGKGEVHMIDMNPHHDVYDYDV